MASARCQATTDTAWIDAEILFAGLAPGLTGMYQLSIRIPLNAAAQHSFDPDSIFIDCAFPSNLHQQLFVRVPIFQ